MLLSYALKVLVIDLDQQGNFRQACNIDAENKPVTFDVIKDLSNIMIILVMLLRVLIYLL